MAWLHLSSREAIVLILSELSLLLIAFSAWGTSGLFSPILGLGALIGYGLGNAMGSSWALPMAIAGAASTLASAFRIPIAASGLIPNVARTQAATLPDRPGPARQWMATRCSARSDCPHSSHAYAERCEGVAAVPNPDRRGPTPLKQRLPEAQAARHAGRQPGAINAGSRGRAVIGRQSRSAGVRRGPLRARAVALPAHATDHRSASIRNS